MSLSGGPVGPERSVLSYSAHPGPRQPHSFSSWGSFVTVLTRSIWKSDGNKFQPSRKYLWRQTRSGKRPLCAWGPRTGSGAPALGWCRPAALLCTLSGHRLWPLRLLGRDGETHVTEWCRQRRLGPSVSVTLIGLYFLCRVIPPICRGTEGRRGGGLAALCNCKRAEVNDVLRFCVFLKNIFGGKRFPLRACGLGLPRASPPFFLPWGQGVCKSPFPGPEGSFLEAYGSPPLDQAALGSDVPPATPAWPGRTQGVRPSGPCMACGLFTFCPVAGALGEGPLPLSGVPGAEHELPRAGTRCPAGGSHPPHGFQPRYPQVLRGPGVLQLGGGHPLRAPYIPASHPAFDACGLTLGETLNMPVPQFPCLYNGDTAGGVSGALRECTNALGTAPSPPRPRLPPSLLPKLMVTTTMGATGAGAPSTPPPAASAAIPTATTPDAIVTVPRRLLPPPCCCSSWDHCCRCSSSHYRPASTGHGLPPATGRCCSRKDSFRGCRWRDRGDSYGSGHPASFRVTSSAQSYPESFSNTSLSEPPSSVL